MGAGDTRRQPGMGPDMNDPAFLARMEGIKQQKLKEFQAFLKNDKDTFIRIIGVAAAKNPKISRDAFKAYADEVENMFPQMSAEITKAHEVSPTPAILERNIENIRTRYGVAIRDKIFTLPQGQEAMEAVAKEQQPKSIFSAPVKAVYDGENGGIQWAGLIGGGLAGFLGYKLTAGMGTLINVLATVGIGAAGAYVAHRYIDPKPAPLDIPDFRHDKERTASRGQVREKGDDVAVSTTTQPDFGKILQDADKVPVTDVADARKLGIKSEDKSTSRPAGPAFT